MMTQRQMEYLYSLALMLLEEDNEDDLMLLLAYDKGSQLERLYTAIGNTPQTPGRGHELTAERVATLFRAVCNHHNLLFPEYFNQVADFKEYVLCHNLN